MRKIIMLCCCAILVFANLGVFAYSIDDVPLQLSTETKEDIEAIAPELNFMELVTQTSQMDFNGNKIMNAIYSFFWREIHINAGVMIRLIGIIIVCGVLRNLETSESNSSISKMSFYACYLIQAGLCVAAFSEIISMTQRVSNDMVLFLQLSVPALIAYLVSVGKIASAQALSPGLLLMTQVIAYAIKNLIGPMSYMSLGLALVNNISDNQPLKRLSELIRKTAIFLMSFMLIIFSTAFSIAGLFVNKLDEITLKTTKFTISNLVPIAGGIISETVETLSGAVSVMKTFHSLGMIIILVIMCLVPVIKIIVVMGLFNVTAAITEPFADKRLISSLTDMAGCLSISLSTIIAILLMMIISISVVIKAGG